MPRPVEPRFQPGDRVFSHYTMSSGTIRTIDHVGTDRDGRPYTTWYMVVMDDNRCELLDDHNGNWELARIVPPAVARKYGYDA